MTSESYFWLIIVVGEGTVLIPVSLLVDPLNAHMLLKLAILEQEFIAFGSLLPQHVEYSETRVVVLNLTEFLEVQRADRSDILIALREDDLLDIEVEVHCQEDADEDWEETAQEGLVGHATLVEVQVDHVSEHVERSYFVHWFSISMSINAFVLIY